MVVSLPAPTQHIQTTQIKSHSTANTTLQHIQPHSYQISCPPAPKTARKDNNNAQKSSRKLTTDTGVVTEFAF